MIQAFVHKIAQDSQSVPSGEVSDCIKIAGLNPWVASSLGLGTGALGTYLALAKSDQQQQLESDTKALLGGALGAAGGYYLGKNTPTGSTDSSGLYSANTDITDHDMQYIFGR
jgi:hypothetical protein